MKRTLLLIAALLTLAACSTAPQTDIAVVNIARLTSNWPKFINYNNQLSSDAAAIERSNLSDSDKARQRLQLQQQYAKMQADVTTDVRNAAAQVAKQRNFRLILTREFAAYGGTDITADVEKVLDIHERASPSP
jgi:Skp family chaperone for outer membrane proteins